MGIAGLVLGIISLVLGWVPIVSILALILAIVGLILSIIDSAELKFAGTISIAGIVISAIAFVISGIMTFIFTIGVIIGIGEGLNSQEFKDALNRIEDGYYDVQDNYDLDYYLDDFKQNYDYDFNL